MLVIQFALHADRPVAFVIIVDRVDATSHGVVQVEVFTPVAQPADPVTHHVGHGGILQSKRRYVGSDHQILTGRECRFRNQRLRIGKSELHAVAELPAVQDNRLGAPVEQLDVFLQRVFRVLRHGVVRVVRNGQLMVAVVGVVHDLRDDHVVIGVIHRHSQVGFPGRRIVEIALGDQVGSQPIGNVAVLLRIRGQVLVLDRGAVGPNQSQVFATDAGAESEIGVQVAGRANRIAIGSEDEQMLIRTQRGAGGKRPFGQVVEVVGQVPAVQGDRSGIRVVQFDPVGILQVIVLDDRVVVGHELADDHTVEHQARFQRLDLQPTSSSEFCTPGAHLTLLRFAHHNYLRLPTCFDFEAQAPRPVTSTVKETIGSEFETIPTNRKNPEKPAPQGLAKPTPP